MMAVRGTVGKMTSPEAQEHTCESTLFNRENARDHHKSGTYLLFSVGLS